MFCLGLEVIKMFDSRLTRLENRKRSVFSLHDISKRNDMSIQNRVRLVHIPYNLHCKLLLFWVEFFLSKTLKKKFIIFKTRKIALIIFYRIIIGQELNILS
jgi:hypothetical protein